MLEISNDQRRAALELLGAATRPARKTTRISQQQRSALGPQNNPAFVSYLPTAVEGDEHEHADPGSPTVPSPTACSSPDVPHSVRQSREPELLQPLLSSPRASSEPAEAESRQLPRLGRPLALARNISLRRDSKGGNVRAWQQQMMMHTQLSGASNFSDLMAPMSMLGASGVPAAGHPEAGPSPFAGEQQQQMGKGLQSQWGFAPGSPGAGAKPSSPSRTLPPCTMSLRQSMLTNSLLRPPPAVGREGTIGGPAAAGDAAAAAGGGGGGDAEVSRGAMDSMDWPAEAAVVGDLGVSYTGDSQLGTTSPLFPPTPEGVMAEVSPGSAELELLAYVHGGRDGTRY